MRPASGEINRALEILDAVDLRRLWRGETAGGHDVIAAGHARTVVGDQLPALAAVIPVCGLDPGAEADVATEVVTIGDEAEIAQDFRLRCVFFRPGPFAVEFGIERVAVVHGLDVAACAGIAVPVPGAADIAGVLDHDGGEAGLAKAMQKIKAGKPGAND